METIKLTNIEANLYINGLNTVPPGSIMSYAGSTNPEGWLLCNGQAVSRADYQKLYSTIGTIYGSGNGSTTFNLPNLQDRFPMGKGVDASTLGGIGGANSVTLTSSQMPSHTHTATVSSNGSHSHTGTTNTTGSHSHTYVDAYFAENSGGETNVFGTSAGTDGDNDYRYRSNPVTNFAGDHSHTLTTNTEPNHTHTVTIESSGNGNAVNITNKYITLNYIIRY